MIKKFHAIKILYCKRGADNVMYFFKPRIGTNPPFARFFGEKIMYYITEESDDENEKLSESNTLSKSDMGDSAPRGRFGLIDDMCMARALRDYSTVDALMEEYYRREYMSDRLFGMHKG